VRVCVPAPGLAALSLVFARCAPLVLLRRERLQNGLGPNPLRTQMVRTCPRVSAE